MLENSFSAIIETPELKDLQDQLAKANERKQRILDAKHLSSEKIKSLILLLNNEKLSASIIEKQEANASREIDALNLKIEKYAKQYPLENY